MKKKADWWIVSCEECGHFSLDIIRDAVCQKARRRLWLNGNRNLDGTPRKYPEDYDIPKLCPLENF